MSAVSSPRRMLHLVVGDFPVARLEEVKASALAAGEEAEIFTLTEANAREALEKIFSSDAVAVWGGL